MIKMQRNFEYFRLRFPGKKRLRFFSFFFALSLLFWIITKLSNTYSSSVEFEVNFVNTPDLIVLDQDLEAKVKADITASGFELLIYHFFKKEIDVSIGNADYSSNVAKIDLMGQKFSLQQQLYQNARLNLISPPYLTFSYGALKRMKIPVIPPDKINFKDESRNRFYVYTKEKLKIKCERIFEINTANKVVGFTSKNCF